MVNIVINGRKVKAKEGSTILENARELSQALRYFQASDNEKVYSSLQDELTERLRGRCVLCKHCLPCPQDIDIPNVIDCLEWMEFYGPSHQKQSRGLRFSLFLVWGESHLAGLGSISSFPGKAKGKTAHKLP